MAARNRGPMQMDTNGQIPFLESIDRLMGICGCMHIFLGTANLTDSIHHSLIALGNRHAEVEGDQLVNARTLGTHTQI